MKIKTKNFAYISALLFAVSFCVPIFAQQIYLPGDVKTTLTGKSRVDWTSQNFVSDISLDTQKAGFKLPANRNAASRRLSIKLPVLVKDPLLSILIDSDTTIDDMVRGGTVTLEQVTDIIENGKRTVDVFDRDGVTLKTTNTINMIEISSFLSSHRYPTAPREPIDVIASRKYSGIIIDARGTLPVHGEYISDNVSPCFYPKIWNTNMDVVFERAMVSIPVIRNQSIVQYDWSEDRSRYEDRVGSDPLFITAEKVYGRNRTDPVIRDDDALRILTVPENRKLLTEGKIVILLDKDALIHDVSVPERNASYYALYDTLREFVYRDMTGVTVTDTIEGIRFSVDLKFEPDSSRLLSSEFARVEQIASRLRDIVATGGYTILIEGHTADIGRPVGQQNLSVERTRAVMRELVSYGIDESLFTYIGYGGTQPIASNETEEGRAQNRRVDIIVRPRATYIQRN